MKKSERERLAKIFHEAAERIETGEVLGCCAAIDNDGARILFESLYEGDARIYWGDALYKYYWFGIISSNGDASRVLALCLAAELVRDGFFG